MYKGEIHIKFGPRFILDVGWYPEMNPDGYFAVEAIQDNDWINPVSKTQCQKLNQLKEAIEKTALLIDEMRAIEDLPYRNIEYEGWD